jgi:hypothetical protein
VKERRTRTTRLADICWEQNGGAGLRCSRVAPNKFVPGDRGESGAKEQSTFVTFYRKYGTREPDGTRRRYFLHVPPSMQSPRQAVAWTYGLSPEQYEIAVRT